jgi:molecular chaperone GrpE
MTEKNMRQERVRQEQGQGRAEAESPLNEETLAPVVEGAEGAEAGRSSPAPLEQVSELQDRYLRLAADFENFRRRAAKERAELWTKAQADLVARVVDALDDLARFAGIDPVETDSRTMHQGVEMVDRKLWKQLNAAGVQRIDETGVPFDPKIHEAVTTAPASTPERDHTVDTVLVVQLWSAQEPPAS